ncbi:hypothetical protein P7C71_g3873, partial [Lecanoromycetidae sp. Uapishka_2]
MPSRTSNEWSRHSNESSSRSDYGSNHSDSGSHRSNSTALTERSEPPSSQQYDSNGNPYRKTNLNKPQYEYLDYTRPQTSSMTYESSISSEEGFDDDLPPFEIPDDGYEAVNPTALASSPQEFAEYFPSTQKLLLRHDDSTMDGNMNLRVDTQARTYDGGNVDLTLFHLRMHDLKRREFSLRRYCRDSGREVCHSQRKYTKPSVMTRPGLQRSMSSALSSLRSKSETKTPTLTGLKRHDSGYDSMPEDEEAEEEVASSFSRPSSSLPIPTNTTQLEFSNYSHIEVKRRGAKASKRYEFEYWGIKYAWKRIAVRSGNFKEISYHLTSAKTSESLAHIIPVPRSISDIREEQAKGGWVPPCAMTFEESVLASSTDLADVIVSSGLIALVDDCIKNQFHQKRRVLTVPILNKSPLKMNMEYVGPKRLMDEVFNRSYKTFSRHPPPSRHTTSQSGS